MNAISIPRPLSADDTTVTLDRAAWETLVEQLEDAADLAAVAANAAHRAAVGEEVYDLECLTDAEVTHFLDSEPLLSILPVLRRTRHQGARSQTLA